jgi:hypothetical protein
VRAAVHWPRPWLRYATTTTMSRARPTSRFGRHVQYYGHVIASGGTRRVHACPGSARLALASEVVRLIRPPQKPHSLRPPGFVAAQQQAATGQGKQARRGGGEGTLSPGRRQEATADGSCRSARLQFPRSRHGRGVRPARQMIPGLRIMRPRIHDDPSIHLRPARTSAIMCLSSLRCVAR